MEKVILFLNSFFSYLLLFAVIVAICGIAVFIGIKLRKHKNNQFKDDKVKEIAES